MNTSHLICSVSAESLLIHLLISRGGGNVATSHVFQNPRDPKPGETVHLFTLHNASGHNLRKCFVNILPILLPIQYCS